MTAIRNRHIAMGIGAAAVLFAILVTAPHGQTEEAVAIPAPAMLAPTVDGATVEKAVLAGGCFWGVQAVFQHVKGVTNAVSGYAGGGAETAQYETVGSGQTDHAEAVEITFDPQVINYATILQIYFSVAHNPTQLNYQGPDYGTQYRSAIFPANESQAAVANAYIAQLGKAASFAEPIVTSIEPGAQFYAAEDYHQDYATLHPDSPYIAHYDLPKVENLSRMFPALYTPQPRLVKG